MRNKKGGVSSLGGWLYADLMLILFIGILSQVALPPEKIIDASPILTGTPTLTPTIRPTTLARVGRDGTGASLRSTPSVDGAEQGALSPDSFVYIVDRKGEWASVVITTYINATSLRDPNDPIFRTPLPPTRYPKITGPTGPTPTATALPSLSRRKVPITVPMPRSLSVKSPEDARIKFRETVLDALTESLIKERFSPNAKIGMVLAFGGAPEGEGGSSIGNDTARRTNAILQESLADKLGSRFAGVTDESFHDYGVPVDSVQLWIYIYVN
jgi:hypothetical protein